MPVRRNVVRALVQRVVGIHTWNGLLGEPVTIPRTEWDRAVDSADQLYDELVREIDWSRILIEAQARHIQVHIDRHPTPCGECVREALLYDERGLGLSALHKWTDEPTIPRRETSPDWPQAFSELVRWRRSDDVTDEAAAVVARAWAAFTADANDAAATIARASAALADDDAGTTATPTTFEAGR